MYVFFLIYISIGKIHFIKIYFINVMLMNFLYFSYAFDNMNVCLVRSINNSISINKNLFHNIIQLQTPTMIITES